MKLSKPEVHRRQQTLCGILTEDEVAVIKWHLQHDTYSVRELAELYDMSLWSIRAIRKGDTWRNVAAKAPHGLEGAAPEGIPDSVKMAVDAATARALDSPPAGSEDDLKAASDKWMAGLIAAGIPVVDETRGLDRLNEEARKRTSNAVLDRLDAIPDEGGSDVDDSHNPT